MGAPAGCRRGAGRGRAPGGLTLSPAPAVRAGPAASRSPPAARSDREERRDCAGLLRGQRPHERRRGQAGRADPRPRRPAQVHDHAGHDHAEQDRRGDLDCVAELVDCRGVRVVLRRAEPGIDQREQSEAQGQRPSSGQAWRERGPDDRAGHRGDDPGQSRHRVEQLTEPGDRESAGREQSEGRDHARSHPDGDAGHGQGHDGRGQKHRLGVGFLQSQADRQCGERCRKDQEHPDQPAPWRILRRARGGRAHAPGTDCAAEGQSSARSSDSPP